MMHDMLKRICLRTRAKRQKLSILVIIVQVQVIIVQENYLSKYFD